MHHQIETMSQKNDNKPMNVLVVGATGGTGRAVVERLLMQGHKVTAFSRNTSALKSRDANLSILSGDVSHPADLAIAVKGQDAVIVTLGITENPFKVRFFGASKTPNNVRSLGTQNVIQAMHNEGVKRLVVQSTFGVGETRGLLGFLDQLFFSLLLKPQILDTELQESFVRESNLDWVLAQPVHLTDEVSEANPFLSTKGQTNVMKVARQSVAKFLILATTHSQFTGTSVAVSGWDKNHG
jgi:putative NADH-flavin reductase